MNLSTLKTFVKKPKLNIKVESVVLDDANVVSALYARNVEILEELEDSPEKMSMEETEKLWTIQANRINDHRRDTGFSKG